MQTVRGSRGGVQDAATVTPQIASRSRLHFAL
jgi:hypothetical protein